MADCIFRKIAAREVPAYVVFEDDQVLAFLDIHPVRTGHTLIIPKAHYSYVEELPSAVLAGAAPGCRDAAAENVRGSLPCSKGPVRRWSQPLRGISRFRRDDTCSARHQARAA